MKIKDIKAVELKAQPPPMYSTKAERPIWFDGAEIANPMSRYPRYKADRNSWRPKWGEVACVVTAEDGTWGLGMTIHGAPVVSIINDHLGPMLHGDDFMAIEKLWDMMSRLASPYSAAGMASYAISAVDLALWDLKGKILRRPSSGQNILLCHRKRYGLAHGTRIQSDQTRLSVRGGRRTAGPR